MENLKKKSHEELSKLTIDEIVKYVDDLKLESDESVASIFNLGLPTSQKDEKGWTHKNIQKLLDHLKEFFTTFYQRLQNMSEDEVVCLFDSLDKSNDMYVNTFILHVNRYKDVYDYSVYSQTIGRLFTGCKALLKDKKAEIVGDKLDPKNDVLIVRLFKEISFTKKAEIQVFPSKNFLDAMLNNLHLPWGPYEFTDFMHAENEKIVSITFDELDKIVKEFIKNNDLKEID